MIVQDLNPLFTIALKMQAIKIISKQEEKLKVVVTVLPFSTLCFLW